ncbi:aldose 1-epimerase family protein [Rufibacter latericius]|uniref:Aldose 1-epimerase family protein n=1 Tax=Rufibacter latericius TaxID=2487040 RepID=A0A3M9MMB6_9BACT|nr:aldose 1-epimerase family protein [Rufibacter latericius]RNI26013.1 aldose 1-epimerase family protein [Rufibacter latericius]
MKTTYLENEYLRLGVKSAGAELCSLVKKDNNLEYLWQADASFWNRHAPVLFPIVGRLPQDQYLHQGKPYTLPQHGFARDQEFELVEESQHQLVYELKATPESLKVYPFSFVLRIVYTLQDQTVEVRWQVHHAGEGEMLFSIGAHPAFNVPLVPGSSFEDYYLEFSQPELLSRYLLEDGTGLQNGQTEPVLENMAILPLRYGHYEKDALVFKDFRSERVTLKSDQNPHFVQMQFANFPYLGIWTKRVGAPFLCIEPWYGIAGTAGNPVELRDKEGMQSLGTGETFDVAYSITVG